MSEAKNKEVAAASGLRGAATAASGAFTSEAGTEALNLNTEWVDGRRLRSLLGSNCPKESAEVLGMRGDLAMDAATLREQARLPKTPPPPPWQTPPYMLEHMGIPCIRQFPTSGASWKSGKS